MSQKNLPGIFITIEGVEGSGKSTLRARLAAELESIWSKITVTREPGATEIGRTIRSILLDPNMQKPCEVAELFLFCADRAQHIEEVIRPSLLRGELVICDRYIHSTLAYQGYGRGMSLEDLRYLINISTNTLLPDMVLLLDLDPGDGLMRVNQRIKSSEKLPSHSVTEVIDRASLVSQASQVSQGDTKITRFEQEDISFHERVRDGFLSLSTQGDTPFEVINASRSQDDVFTEAYNAVAKLIEARNK